MKRWLALAAAVAALALGVAPADGASSWVSDCRFRSAPQVVSDEPGRLLQYWIEVDRPELWDARLPASASLHEFRERIARSFETQARRVLERQLPHTTGGDRENVRLVLDGEAGSVRPMSCLEALLLSIQTERSVGQGRSMYTHPTEFVSYVLKRADTLKVWFYTVDQPGIGGLATLHEPLLRDLEEGWTVETNIHNHNFFPDTEAVLGGVVPSTTDVQYLRNMRASTSLTRASITNGFHSIDLSLADLERFVGR